MCQPEIKDTLQLAYNMAE